MDEEEKSLFSLSSLNNENIIHTFNFIKESTFISSKLRCRTLTHILVYATKRCSYIEPFGKLAKLIFAEFPEFKEILLHETTSGSIDDYFIHLTRGLFFLRKCFKEGIFTIKEIIDFIDKRRIEERNYEYKDKISHQVFFWFFPEIKSFDKSKSASFINTFNDKLANNFFINWQKTIIVEQNESLSYLLDHLYLPNNPRKYIECDDVDGLVSFSSDPLFDIEAQYYPGDFFNLCDVVFSNHTLLSYCAGCGSVKCFKFTVLNNAKTDYPDLFINAIAGGSMEIIHYVESFNPNYEDACVTAATYCRFDVLRWILTTKIGELSKERFFEVLSACCANNNIISLKEMILRNMDIENAQILLNIACKFHHDTIITFLLCKCNAVMTKKSFKFLDKQTFEIIKKYIKKSK